jgi:hypothetical protein
MTGAFGDLEEQLLDVLGNRFRRQLACRGDGLDRTALGYLAEKILVRRRQLTIRADWTDQSFNDLGIDGRAACRDLSYGPG